jgi:DNA-binding transcriptional regulator YiaG
MRPSSPASMDRMRAAELVLISQTRADLASGAARQAREAVRISQREAAEALGVTQSAVSHWETGRSVPSGDLALAYGRLLRQLARKAA